MSTSEAEHLVLRLDGFEGPLDLLLDLARAQKVDLAKISILALVEQYLAVIEGARRIRLELAADWLVMAAWLTWLKSRLLLPEGADAEEGEQAADVLAARLRDLSAMRAAAAWLAGRPQLGPGGVRARRTRGPHRDRPLAAGAGPGVAGARLSPGDAPSGSGTRRYQPRPLSLWSVKDALQRLAALLGSLPDWTSLDRFLPDALGGAAGTACGAGQHAARRAGDGARRRPCGCARNRRSGRSWCGAPPGGVEEGA